MTDEDKKTSLIRSFGRRKNKSLKKTHADTLAEVLSFAGIRLPEGDDVLDPKSFFDFDAKEVWFEIGFGRGEHLIHQALNNPDVGLIGCEPFLNGVSALALEIKKHNIKNIRIWDDDARLLMSRIKDHSLDKLFLLHPDPWPKTRHHKRRFVQAESLTEISRLLKKGAEFRMATDHADLSKWMLEKAYFHPNFEWKAKCANDWRTAPDDWIDTRYCNKGKDWEHTQVYLNFENISLI